MKNSDLFICDALKGFQSNKGKGSLYCFTKDISYRLICETIIQFNNKNAGERILVVVGEYKDRVELLKQMTAKGINDTDYNVKVLTTTFINLKYHHYEKLCIMLGVNDDIDIISQLSNDSKFTMCILTENIMNNEFISNVRSKLPQIITGISDNNLRDEYLQVPVEEHHIGVMLSEEDRKLYDKYTEYINTTISIIGDISIIDKCKNGDSILNITAAEFRETIARNNGWSERLDVTVDFQRKIDEIYNPNAIADRVANFYNIAKNRRDLVSCAKCKLEKIAELCKENANKNILILSKKGSFANDIVNYLKDNGIESLPYHNEIDDAPLIDANGNYICWKSGKKKGQPRIVGSQYQSSANLRRFNLGETHILSAKFSSDTGLEIACDVLILTTSLCDDIIDIKRRFSNIKFNGTPNICYKIYSNGTIENDKINKDKISPIVTVIDDTKNSFSYIENNDENIL